MINQSTIDSLKAMKLTAMADELEHQLEDVATYGVLGFKDRIRLLIDVEWNRRQVTNWPDISKMLIFPHQMQPLKGLSITITVSLTKQKSYVLPHASTLKKDTTSSLRVLLVMVRHILPVPLDMPPAVNSNLSNIYGSPNYWMN